MIAKIYTKILSIPLRMKHIPAKRIETSFIKAFNSFEDETLRESRSLRLLMNVLSIPLRMKRATVVRQVAEPRCFQFL